MVTAVQRHIVLAASGGGRRHAMVKVVFRYPANR